MCRLVISTALLLAMILPVGLAQQQPKARLEYDVKKCTPKVERRMPLPKPKSIRVHKGEKSMGYAPLIAFEILESGEVANVHVKRSSGLADLDTYAFNCVRGTKYNSRPGCGVIETETTVLIHF